MSDQTLSENIESIKNEIINDDNNNFDTYLFNHHKINYNEEPLLIPTNIEHKYGDDTVFESWADNNIFLPIATKLVDPLYNLSLTPNNVTVLSTIFTFLSIYFLHNDKNLYAVIAYFIGYLFDCVDGKMARKYNMSSKYGMALDLVSDNVSNIAIFAYLINRFGLTNKFVLVIIFMSYMLGISYGLNEAIVSHKTTGNDNFLQRRELELKSEKDYIFTLFLYITKISYRSYRSFFKEYDEEKIYKWLSILKHFGPGNYCLLVSLILLYIE